MAGRVMLLAGNTKGLAVSRISGVGKGAASAAPGRLFAGFNQRNVHEVLADEPDLEFVGPQHIADDHVVGTIVAQFGGSFSQGAALPNDDLMSIQQSRELDRNFLTAS